MTMPAKQPRSKAIAARLRVSERGMLRELGKSSTVTPHDHYTQATCEALRSKGCVTYHLSQTQFRITDFGREVVSVLDEVPARR